MMSGPLSGRPRDEIQTVPGKRQAPELLIPARSGAAATNRERAHTPNLFPRGGEPALPLQAAQRRIK